MPARIRGAIAPGVPLGTAIRRRGSGDRDTPVPTAIAVPRSLAPWAPAPLDTGHTAVTTAVDPRGSYSSKRQLFRPRVPLVTEHEERRRLVDSVIPDVELMTGREDRKSPLKAGALMRDHPICCDRHRRSIDHDAVDGRRITDRVP